jgi:Tol biopolymer transport system component
MEIFITIDDDIYSVNLRKSTFSPQKLNINTKYVECSPCLSPDGTTLYFVSDRPGGSGGKDIWSSERLSNGNWSEPVNLGKKVNTTADEESPYMMADNATLYFSSKGLTSIGGYDIFVSTRNDDGFWSMPESLGAPINTTADDFFYITDTYGKRAFYSSDKTKQGNQDIYFVSFKK